MKIVVDTNIIFSALLNSNSNIGNILFNSQDHFDFYSCEYMVQEIHNHWDKLKVISKLSEDQLKTSFEQIKLKLTFINEELIPPQIWNASEKIASAIDIDDIDFIALADFLKAHLWTGDKTLYNGLKAINSINVLNTEDILVLRFDKKV